MPATTSTDQQQGQSGLLDVPVDDPPPPYPSQERRTRALRTTRRHPQRLAAPILPRNDLPSRDSGQAAGRVVSSGQQPRSFPSSDDPTDTTPLLDHSLLIASPRRPRANSRSSTIISSDSCAHSFVQTVFSLSQDSDDEPDLPALGGGLPSQRDQDNELGQGADVQAALYHGSRRWPLFSRRAWMRYFRPMGRRAYHAAVFHLMVVNFPYALIAWIYLFVFTLTGTTLLITLPLGALLCFLDLLGARAFARGELALQTKFHGPLAYPPPYPPRPIFQRTRRPRLSEVEFGQQSSVQYETSFYKNAYAMFTDATTYQALFYFLVIKPGITFFVSITLAVLVPVSYVLVLPAPLMLRFVRKLGIWQANVAVEGLYHEVS
ncbi:hypothetical protein BDN67DRAFT_608483 [Paxillus ammoniavirescens]|nr:hypothetical protein BDN67DRAFT_608483 [Paxillus ammoniavirescens]